MKTSRLIREFSYAGVKLPDPNPGAPVEEAVRLLSGQYPELQNAKIEPSTTVDGGDRGTIELFNLKVAATTKG